MASFSNASASIRMMNESRRSICTVNNINPLVSAETATAFVNAIETIYNNGRCTARLSIIQDIIV